MKKNLGKYLFRAIAGTIALLFIYKWVMGNMQSYPLIPSDAEKAYAEKVQGEYEEKLKGDCAGLSVVECRRKFSKPK